jgi:hypothetical protein
MMNACCFTPKRDAMHMVRAWRRQMLPNAHPRDDCSTDSSFFEKGRNP